MITMIKSLFYVLFATQICCVTFASDTLNYKELSVNVKNKDDLLHHSYRLMHIAYTNIVLSRKFCPSWIKNKKYENTLYNVMPEAFANCINNKKEFKNMKKGELIKFDIDYSKLNQANWNAVLYYNLLADIIHENFPSIIIKNGMACDYTYHESITDKIDKLAKMIFEHYKDNGIDNLRNYIDKARNDIKQYMICGLMIKNRFDKETKEAYISTYFNNITYQMNSKINKDIDVKICYNDPEFEIDTIINIKLGTETGLTAFTKDTNKKVVLSDKLKIISVVAKDGKIIDRNELIEEQTKQSALRKQHKCLKIKNERINKCMIIINDNKKKLARYLQKKLCDIYAIKYDKNEVKANDTAIKELEIGSYREIQKESDLDENRSYYKPDNDNKICLLNEDELIKKIESYTKRLKELETDAAVTELSHDLNSKK